MSLAKLVYPGFAALFTAALFYFFDVIRGAPTLIIPGSAVIAFNLVKCPEGWVDYEKAKGRFIVGVGESVGLTEKLLQEREGKETVQLVEAEMPSHNHNPPSTGGGSDTGVYALQAAGMGEYGGRHARPTDSRGGNQSHENMPPYVALRFCIKK